jgi:hypothetical protein
VRSSPHYGHFHGNIGRREQQTLSRPYARAFAYNVRTLGVYCANSEKSATWKSTLPLLEITLKRYRL